MAEIETPPRLLDDIRDFIDEKWRHSECELCGTDQWMVYGEPNQYAYLLASGEPGTLHSYAHVTVGYLPLSCSNCGNLRLIDTRIFSLWRKGKKMQTTR
jgi:hypothetical protein